VKGGWACGRGWRGWVNPPSRHSQPSSTHKTATVVLDHTTVAGAV